MNSSILTPQTTLLRPNNHSKFSTVDLTRCNHGRSIRNKTLQVTNIAGIENVPVSADSAGLTWQILVGTAAGVTPFVVAGIEFSKRIIAQRRCEVCEGSGLILKKEIYVKCTNCGGFLPWQSWKRFFSG